MNYKISTKAYIQQMYETNVTDKEIDYIEIRQSLEVHASEEAVIPKSRHKQYRVKVLERRDMVRDVDMMFTKQRTWFKDKTFVDEFVVRRNFRRCLYVTRPLYRNHKQKKTREFLKKLELFLVPTSHIPYVGGLQVHRQYKSVRDIRRDRFIYGTEIDAKTLLKQYHLIENRNKVRTITPYTICYFDIEASTLDPKTNEIYISSTLCDFRIVDGVKVHDGIYLYMYATKDYIANCGGTAEVIEQKLIALTKKNIPEAAKDWLSRDNIHIKLIECDDGGDIGEKTFIDFHYMEPDIVSGWNVMFDIESIKYSILQYDTRSDGTKRVLEDIMCDPRVPKQYRVVNIVPGKTFSVTESGKKKTILPHQRLHTFEIIASFAVLDNMVVHYYVREGEKSKKGGYGIDKIGKALIQFQKNTLVELPELGGKLHARLVREYPIEYMFYNVNDNFLLYGINHKTRDLDVNMPLLMDISEWSAMGKNTNKTMDDLHFSYLRDGKVLGTFVTDKAFEKDVPICYEYDRTGWTTTLDQSLRLPRELELFVDFNEPLMIDKNALDVDQEAGYPSNTELTGMSGETVALEVIKIEDIDNDEFTIFCKGQILGDIYSGSYARIMEDLPDYIDTLNDISAQMLEDGVIDSYEKIETYKLPEVNLLGDMSVGLEKK